MYRVILTAILLILMNLDLLLTYIYVKGYKNYSPNIDLRAMEGNVMLVLLMRTFGIGLGMVIGGIIISSILIVIGMKAYLVIIISIIIVQLLTIYNNYKNIKLLQKVIREDNKKWQKNKKNRKNQRKKEESLETL